MKSLGILGGMSWESTVTYYRLLNEGVRTRLGGLHSCKIVMNSVDFDGFEKNMSLGHWDRIGDDLAAAASSVEAGGAEALIIATNTMHKVADRVQSAVNIPLLHMADAIAGAVKGDEVEKIGLLGTSFTMEQDFLSRPLKEKYGLDVLVPELGERNFVHRTIFEELCCGRIIDETRAGYIQVINELAKQGAQAVVLGCTEIGLLVQPGDVDVPLIDTVQAHVNLALDHIME